MSKDKNRNDIFIMKPTDVAAFEIDDPRILIAREAIAKAEGR